MHIRLYSAVLLAAVSTESDIVDTTDRLDNGTVTIKDTIGTLWDIMLAYRMNTDRVVRSTTPAATAAR